MQTETQVSSIDQKVADFLEKNPKTIAPANHIALALGLDPELVKPALRRLVKKEVVEKKEQLKYNVFQLISAT